MHRPGGFPIGSGHRSLIGLSGTRIQDGTPRRSYGRNEFFYGGWPYFPPEYQASYEPEVMVQPTAPKPAVLTETKQDSLPSAALLELQGNQWVKVSSFATATAPTSSSAPAKELPATVLIYRDGRSEELRSYSIIGTTLYAKADYLTSGTWTRKVQLADLDLRATVKQNQERGLRFDLPSGPNEVVLRP